MLYKKDAYEEIHEEIATVWLMDTIAGQAEEDDGNVFSRDRSEIIRSQEDYGNLIQSYLAEKGIDLKAYLPIEAARDFCKSVEDVKWAGKLSVYELKEFNPKTVYQLAMAATGSGVGIEDDTETVQFLREKGIGRQSFSSIIDVQSITMNIAFKIEDKIREDEKLEEDGW